MGFAAAVAPAGKFGAVFLQNPVLFIVSVYQGEYRRQKGESVFYLLLRLLLRRRFVFISHCHADHHLGLLSLLQCRAALWPSARPPLVIAPARLQVGRLTVLLLRSSLLLLLPLLLSLAQFVDSWLRAAFIGFLLMSLPERFSSCNDLVLFKILALRLRFRVEGLKFRVQA